MSASRTMSLARVEPTRMRGTLCVMSASRKACQAARDAVGFSSAKLITSTPCSRCKRASSAAKRTGSRWRHVRQKSR